MKFYRSTVWLLGLVLLATLLPVLGTLPDAPPAAAQAGQSAFGVNSHIATRYGTYETLDVALQTLGETNPGWAREEFQWSLVTDKRRDATYNWDMLDRVINSLHSRGINIIGLLNDDPAAGPPRGDQLNGFVNFAELPLPATKAKCAIGRFGMSRKIHSTGVVAPT